MPTIAAEHKKGPAAAQYVRMPMRKANLRQLLARRPEGILRPPGSNRAKSAWTCPEATSDVKAGQQTAGPGITRVGAGLGLRSKTGAAGNGSRRGNRVV